MPHQVPSTHRVRTAACLIALVAAPPVTLAAFTLDPLAPAQAELLPASAPGAVLPAARALRDSAVARIVSPDTTAFAEGISVDPRSGTYYVTSIRHRNVFAVDGRGGWRPLIVPSGASVGAAFGVAIDTLRDVAWVTTAKLPFMAPAPDDSLVRAELLRVRLRDGAIIARWTLGDGTGMPGEIALASDGSVLVSDGLKGQLYRLRADATGLEVVRSLLLRSPQGIAVDPAAKVAWVADWSRGIMRWDLVTDSITSVATAEGAVMKGVDGLKAWQGRLIGVQNGRTPPRVVEVELSADGRTLVGLRTLDQPPAAGEPTVGVIHGDRYVYVASSAWPFWTEEGARKADTGPLPPVTLRELRLTR